MQTTDSMSESSYALVSCLDLRSHAPATGKRVASGSFEASPDDTPHPGEDALLLNANVTHPSPPPTSSSSLAVRLETFFRDREKRTLVIDGIVAAILLIYYIISESSSPSVNPWIPGTLAGDYSYPLKAQTVPSWVLPLVALIFPAVIFAVIKIVQKRPTYELTRLVFALISSVFLTALTTNMVKVMVSRPRPNFLSVCFGSATPNYQSNNEYGGFPICTASRSAIKEHLKSFPSGHSSFAAAGLGFLTYYLLGLTKCLSGGYYSTGRLFISVKPSMIALLIGVSRVMDCWHHPSDVVAGLSLGFLIAFLFYRVLYPSVFASDCDIPYSISSGPKQEGPQHTAAATPTDPNQHGPVVNQRPADSPV